MISCLFRPYCEVKATLEIQELHVVNTNIPRMILQLNNVHANAFIVFPNEMKTTIRKTLNIVRIDFISVTVAFINDSLPYSLRSFDHSLTSWKKVGRLPSLIVSPIVDLSISGMKMTTGSGVCSDDSMEFASGMSHM